MKAFIYPYKKGSQSAKALAAAAQARRIKHEGSKFKPAHDKLLVNWGSSSLPMAFLRCGRVLNHPEKVGVCSDKMMFFNRLSQSNVPVRIPQWTGSRGKAMDWVEVGHTVVARKVLRGHSGEGIHIINDLDDMVNAPLYTKYIKKKDEYRVHIFCGEVIMVQRKARKLDVPDDKVNWQVRNHANGFIFEHKEVFPPVDVIDQAQRAISATGLDFGAVDVVYNAKEDKAYVLEINCAPGLEGHTLEVYSQAIQEEKRA